MRNRFVSILTKEASRNDKIVLMTGDIGYNVLDPFFDKYPDRYINAGISEQNMTSVAAGLALSGKCVVTYSIGSFSTLRCFEQIRNDICYHNANVKIVSLAAGFAYGQLGMSHHATEDIGCMKSLPNMTIFSPCDPEEAEAVTKAALALDTPCYIRLGRGREPVLHKAFDCNDFEVGKAYLMHSGKSEKVVIFATGAVLEQAKKAVTELADKGIDISLYSFPTIKPLDSDLISSAAYKYDNIVTVEENNIYSGFGSSVADVLSGCRDRRAVLTKIGLNDIFPSVVGDTEYLRSIYGMDSDSIKSIVMRIM